MDGAVVLNWGSDTIKGGQVSRFPSDNEPYVVRHGFLRSGPLPLHIHVAISATNLSEQLSSQDS